MDLSSLELRLRIARPFGSFVDSDDRRVAAKAFAKAHGHYGRTGGWIYRTGSSGKVFTVCQGWDNYFWLYRRDIADELTRTLTAFESFSAMVEKTAPSYRPSIYPLTWRERLLADLYDQAQEKRDDPRRAYVGWDRYDYQEWRRMREQRDELEAAS